MHIYCIWISYKLYISCVLLCAFLGQTCIMVHVINGKIYSVELQAILHREVGLVFGCVGVMWYSEMHMERITILCAYVSIWWSLTTTSLGVAFLIVPKDIMRYQSIDRDLRAHGFADSF